VDLPPPNIARMMQDGHLESSDGQRVPVLVQSGSYRLIILNSVALARMHSGQRMTLHLQDAEAQPITLQEIDHLALIARYTEDRGGG
jgi:hypothetical protein